jgi:glycosyltransferase involved in cell wall biosynthesis
MSTVAVVTSSPPFVDGGHLVIARSLVEALASEGHAADLVVTPQNRFGRQGTAYLANWMTDVGITHDGRAVDRVISLRYPAFAVRHPRHVCWLTHTMREYYDLWETFRAPLSWRNRAKEGVRRRVMHTADRYFLSHHVRRLFVISATVQRRLERDLGLVSEVLYPPAPPRSYRCERYEPWLFAVSRLAPLKRMSLIVEALAEPAARHVRLVLAGDGEEREALEGLVARHGLGPRVLLAGRVDETALVERLSRCRGVVFVPFDEDYGFVTAEAFASGKPVVTTRDSGGPAELVRDGVNGLVVEPTPAALAAAMARLADDETAAVRMGTAARDGFAGVTWPATVARLLAPLH